MADGGDAAAPTPVVVMSPLGEVSPRNAPGELALAKKTNTLVSSPSISQISNMRHPLHCATPAPAFQATFENIPSMSTER